VKIHMPTKTLSYFKAIISKTVCWWCIGGSIKIPERVLHRCEEWPWCGLKNCGRKSIFHV
jgi:hypothetical protein